MKFLMIVSVILVTVCGRPEPPKAYQYSSPTPPLTNSYSVPLASVGPIPNNSPKESSEPTPGVSSSASNELTNGSIISSSISQTPSFPPFDVVSGNDNEVSISETDSNDQSQSVVEKSIYVHLPSPELEEQQRAVVQLPLPRIHYKIIFIKAPTAANAAPVIPALPQDEERTIIYVLVRKPEEQQDIVIPTAKPTGPSKPEVYFIRYKTQTDESSGSPDVDDSSLDVATKSSASRAFNDVNGDDNAVSGEYGSAKPSAPY